MIRITEADLQRGLGALAERARREPVTITTDGRDDLVVLSAEDSNGAIDGLDLPRISQRSGLKPCATPECQTNSPPSMPN